MKFFCAVVLVVLVAVALPGCHGRGFIIRLLKSQSCIDFDKVKETIGKGGEGCPQVIPNAEADAASETVFTTMRPSRLDFSKISDLLEKTKQGIDCFMKGGSIRNDNDETIIANLEATVSAIAKSPAKGDAINAIIQKCNTRKNDGAATLPAGNRLQFRICVLFAIFTERTCKPESAAA